MTTDDEVRRLRKALSSHNGGAGKRLRPEIRQWIVTRSPVAPQRPALAGDAAADAGEVEGAEVLGEDEGETDLVLQACEQVRDRAAGGTLQVRTRVKVPSMR